MTVFQHAIGKRENTLTSHNHFRGEMHSSVSPLWENPEGKVVFHQALELSILNNTRPIITAIRPSQSVLKTETLLTLRLVVICLNIFCTTVNFQCD